MTLRSYPIRYYRNETRDQTTWKLIGFYANDRAVGFDLMREEATLKWNPFLLFQSIPCHGTQVRNYKIKQGIWQLFVRKTKIILILIEFYLLLTLGICLCKSNAKCGVYM